MAKQRRRKIPFSTYLFEDLKEKLEALSSQSRIAIVDLVCEAIEDLLRKKGVDVDVEEDQ